MQPNKEVVSDYVREMTKDFTAATVDRYHHESFVNHGPSPNPAMFRDLPAYKMFMEGMHAAFPDLAFSVDDLISEGDRVVWRTTITGTHDGPLMGMPPTGRKVKVGGVHVFRIENGKFVEHWGIVDMATMMAQIQPPAAAPEP